MAIGCHAAAVVCRCRYIDIAKSHSCYQAIIIDSRDALIAARPCHTLIRCIRGRYSRFQLVSVVKFQFQI